MRRWWILALALIVLVLFTPHLSPGYAHQALKPEAGPKAQSRAAMGGTSAYFPISTREFISLNNAWNTRIGVEDPRYPPRDYPNDYRLFRSIGGTWTRLNGVVWEQIEPTNTSPDQYNWSALAPLEADILAARQAQLEPIVVIRGIPSWARVLPDVPCSRVKPENIPDMVEFVRAVVQRLSQPPYNVRFWEIGNEPDAAPNQVPPGTTAFGCWGDPSSPYYGGEYYADVLKALYPAIKEVNPKADVILGSLLLESPDSPMSKFLDGVLANGGGPYFDIVGFHYYAEQEDVWDPDRFSPLGGLSMKIGFFIDVLERKYGYETSQPREAAPNGRMLFLTEAGRRCWTQVDGEYVCSSYEEQLQGLEVLRIVSTVYYYDVGVVIWHGLREPTWQGSALLRQDGSPKPAFEALKRFSAYGGVCHNQSRAWAGPWYDYMPEDPAIQGRWLGGLGGRLLMWVEPPNRYGPRGAIQITLEKTFPDEILAETPLGERFIVKQKVFILEQVQAVNQHPWALFLFPYEDAYPTPGSYCPNDWNPGLPYP